MKTKCPSTSQAIMSHDTATFTAYGALILMSWLAGGHAIAAEPRKVFGNSIVAIPQVRGLVAAAQPSAEARETQTLELHFGLQAQQDAELRTRVEKRGDNLTEGVA